MAKRNVRNEIRESLEQEAALGKTTANPQLETQIAGLMLQNEDSLKVALSTLRDTDFTDTKLKHIVMAMRQIKASGNLPNRVTIVAHLQATDHLDDAGGEEYISSLKGEGNHSEVAAYCNALKEFSYRRRLKYVASKLTSLSGTADPVSELSGEVRSLLRYAQDDTVPEDAMMNPRGVVEQITPQKFIYALYGETIIDTPWPDLNDMIIGYFRKTLNVVAARPSVGKSAWLGQQALHVARKGEPVAIFSLEMNREDWLRRIVAGIANVDVRKFYKKDAMTPSEIARVAHAYEEIADLPLYISEDGFGGRLDQVEQGVRKLAAQWGKVSLVGIDHLQIMKSLRKHQNRHGELTEITTDLKMWTKAEGLTTVLLSQLSRSAKTRDDKAPQLDDLYESGSIEQNADTVGMLHRPEMFKEDGDKSRTEFYQRKQRMGATGMISLRFEREFTRFDSI